MKFNKLLKESQFHGGRRLAERNCRWYWYISMLVLFGSAVAVICSTVSRFFDNPTYIAYQESFERATDFPSVLVCPEIFFSDEKIDNFLSQMEIPSHLNVSYLKSVIYMLSAHYAPDVIYKAHDLRNIEHLLEFNDMDLDTAARELTTSCDSTLIRCRWRGLLINCTNVFHMELTGDGYCCVFNGRSLKDLREVRYQNHLHRHWFTNRYGHDSGLMLAVNQSQPLTNVDLTYKWLALQGRRHFVESTNNGSALNPGSEHWAEYHVMNFQIGEDARSLSDSLKKCRMTDEPLEFFPIYNKKYCAVECEVAQTLKRCKCIRLVHPRPKGANYCNAYQLLCAQNAMGSGIDDPECYCPPACDSATDYVKISTFALQPEVQTIDTFYDGLNYSKVTIVRAFIMTGLVRTDSRMSYFTNIDLFAQLGGVFNVFFGCSILTLLEIAVLAYRGLAAKVSATRNSKAKAKPQSNQADNKDDKKGKNKKKKLRFKF